MRATFSAYRALPIRWRLAGGSALLTLVILLGFAVLTGTLTTRRVRSDFDAESRAAAQSLAGHLRVGLDAGTSAISCQAPDLGTYANAANAVIRVLRPSGEVLCQTPGAPDLGPPSPQAVETDDYRVASSRGFVASLGPVVVQFARPDAHLEQTIARVWVILGLGVLGGAALALLAGLALARRAMAPIAQITEMAREVERTGDPSRRMGRPTADDEVARLARTLDGMLQALDRARADTQSMLERQREFVADASHELRTPLTSVLANLELLAEELEGEQSETATAALRSSRRMRRLVADLLLLARADAGRGAARLPTDLGTVLVEAAAELEPVARDHELSVDAGTAVVLGARDDLHRLAVNLVENALRHTPPGTRVRAVVAVEDREAVLSVSDDGPGIAPELQDRIFERFVRAGRDGGGGSGLGLAIVEAVVESHGGRVAVSSSPAGSRFVARLPVTELAPPAAPSAQTSTTTGSTIGRRLSRS